MRGFGVDVVVIEPGLIKTRFGETAVGSIDAAAGDGDDPYAEFNAAVGAATAGAYEGPLARLGGGPETVARAIERAISARRPEDALQGDAVGTPGPGPAAAAHRSRLGRLPAHPVPDPPVSGDPTPAQAVRSCKALCRVALD